MMKNKLTLLSTIICILPITLSCVLYSRLPEQIAVHFNNGGQADGFLPKAMFVFGLPLILAAINLYINFRVNNEPKYENVSIYLKVLSKWTAPIMSVVFIPITLFMAIGAEIPVVLISQAIVGVVLIICGNYLPKCKRNYTIGIKLPWTLDSEDNWNKTHRFSGFVWVIGGIGILLNAFLNISKFLVIAIVVLLVVLPFIYSFMLYSKNRK